MGHEVSYRESRYKINPNIVVSVSKYFAISENGCRCENATSKICRRGPVLVCFYFRTSRKSHSGERTRTFPLVFASAPELCQSLMNRLASNNVMAAAFASSSLVMAKFNVSGNLLPNCVPDIREHTESTPTTSSHVSNRVLVRRQNRQEVNGE